MQNILLLGNLSRSTSDNTKAQRSSFVFKLSLVTAALTAAASGLFAYYVLSTFLRLYASRYPDHWVLYGLCIPALPLVAPSAYILIQFSVFSQATKKTYILEDSFPLPKNIPSFRTILGLVILACLTGYLLRLLTIKHGMALQCRQRSLCW